MKGSLFRLPYFLLMFLTVGICVRAQNLEDFETFLNDYGEVLGEKDLTYLYDELLELWEHPLNLNSADEESVHSLPSLSPHEKESLIEYLQRYKPLHSISELLLVEGWTPFTLQKIRPFVYIGESSKKEEIKNKTRSMTYGKWQVRQKCTTRLGPIDGDSAFLGSRFTSTYQLSYNSQPQLQWGINMEKDEGENGLDHTGLYIVLNDINALKQLIIGDYRVHFGQGLILSSGFFGGKNQTCQSLLSNTKSFSAHRSCAESGFHRGMAMQLQVTTKIRLSFFAAGQNVDSNRKDSIFTSLKTDGLHKTSKERDKRHNLRQWTSGIRFQQTQGHFQWALNALYYRFGTEWQPEWKAYNQFHFRGKQGANFSADWRWKRGNWFWGGEWAFDPNGHWAGICHLNGKIHPDIDLLLSLRRFQAKYQAPFANTFCEKSDVCNEEGFFMAGIFRLFPHCDIHCYADIYRFPWLRYGVNAPSAGWDAQAETVWHPTKAFSIKLRHKEKMRSQNILASESPKGVRPIKGDVTQSTHLQIGIQDRCFRFKTSLQISQCEQKKSVCFSQDALYQFADCPLSLYGQYALFDNNQGMSAYLYTYDLVGNMPFSNFNRKGQMFNFLIKYHPSKRIQIHARSKTILYQDERPNANIGCVLTFKF